MNIGLRIKQKRKELGMTQQDLATKLGYTNRATIAKIESGENDIVQSKVVAFAKALQTTPSYLMGWEAEHSSNLSSILPISKKKLPLLGEIACGEPIWCNEERESYVEAGTDMDADFCLKAKGDSMINARIMDGDIVFIRKQSIVENGEIAAVVIENEATLKRVYISEGVCTLQAENPSYAPIVLTGERLMNVHILGKAIAFQSDVR